MDVPIDNAEEGRRVPPSFDSASLDRLKRFGGVKLLREMIDLFLVGATERLAAARAGLDAHDAAAVELALHSLKSSSAQLGAPRMQQLSEEGEALASQGTLDNVHTLVRELEAEFVSVRDWLITVREGATT